jgi:hypothetical protein
MAEHQTSTNRERAVAQFEFHPFADVFHLLDGREFDELVTDIRTHGQREPIVLHEGKILDGRNRFLACRAAGIEPIMAEYTGDDPLAYVISANIMRRHLTTQQRAAIAAELATMKSGARTDLASIDARSQLSDAQAAKLMKVSEPSVERAKARMRIDPDAHEKAKAGTLARAKPTKPKPIDGDRAPEPVTKPPKREDLTVAIRGVALALNLHQRKLAEWAHTVPSFTKRDLLATVRQTREQLADVETALSNGDYDYDRKVRRERTLRAALSAVLEQDGGTPLAEQLTEFWTKRRLGGVHLGDSAEPAPLAGQTTEQPARQTDDMERRNEELVEKLERETLRKDQLDLHNTKWLADAVAHEVAHDGGDQWAARGAAIRVAREAKSLNAKELAELAGVAPNYVSMAELGRLTKSGGPAAGRPTFAKLEAALGLEAAT